MKKNRKKFRENMKNDAPADITENLPIAQHLEEPLLVIGLITFLSALIRPFIGKAILGRGLLIFIFLLGLASIYFIYLYFKSDKRNYWFLGVPILIFLTALFCWYANNSNGFAFRDYTVFSVISGISLLAYVSVLHKIIKPGQAAIFVVFLSTLLIHLAPAYTPPYAQWSGKYLAALDPYYYYRHAEYTINNGFLPERDTLVYPTDPPNHSKANLLVSVLMASLALVTNSFGITLHDIAMIYPGIFAGFTVVALYLLIRDLFSDMKPYNDIAAVLAAFMLMMCPGFAVKAIATNCEDDALGMFLLVSSFLLFTISFRRKSIKFSLLSGFSFLLLKITWAGFEYGFYVFCIFAAFYAVMNFIHKKNCTEHVPYFIIPLFAASISPMLLHTRGIFPGIDEFLNFFRGTHFFIIGAPLFLAFFLEMIRAGLYGRVELKGTKLEYRIENWIQRNIFVIGGVLVLLGILSFIFVANPIDILNYIVHTLKGARVQDIIGQTTAEQNPLCGEFNSGCVRTLYKNFGLGILFGMGMIPVLLYFILYKRSLGAIFVLSWSLPMIWGVINKSQYQFTASVPIVALGSTIGLILVLSKRDLEGLRIIPTMLLLITPLTLPFFEGTMPIFGSFGGSSAMYYGASADRIYWDPTLQWLKTQPEDIRVLTWWDYGHWIAAVSHRISILDNTKARGFQVQDVAKFHVLVESEEEGLEIARKYGATHVIIDWTMIGKSAAPHFIATSNLTAPVGTPRREGERMAYGQCRFSPDNSIIKPKPVPNAEGGFDSVRRVVFICGPGGDYRDYIGIITFEIKNERLSDIEVNPFTVTERGLAYDAPIPWSAWRQEHDASILGVQSIRSILSNAMNYGTDKYVNFPTFNTLIYVPEKFRNYMMTKLYLGDYLDEYREFGLTDIEPLKHFRLVDGFKGDKPDKSYWGYVRVYEIEYPENVVNETEFL